VSSGSDSPPILVVDDDAKIRRLVRTYLERDGHRVVEAADGPAAVEALRRARPSLVVLDLMLPGIDGLSIIRDLRASHDPAERPPVLVLSARGLTSDRIEGLSVGADDYLAKPFGLRELMSRIKALLRRAYGDLADAAGGRVIRHHDLLIDLARRRVQRGDRRLSLTATEFEILRHLASKPGRVFTRRELLELVRDYEALDQDEKTINVHVSHLREKLEDDPSDPQFILTVRGAGYAFAER
jgi:DNA-binding response OmpR family regulator